MMLALHCVPLILSFLHYCSCQSDDFYLPPTIPCWKDGSCMYDPGPCLPEDEPRGLYQVPGVRVGHRQEVDLGVHGKKTLITRAMRPLLFEIPNFLSDEECDYIVRRTMNRGIIPSLAKGDKSPEMAIRLEEMRRGTLAGREGMFNSWDFNMDGLITISEVVQFAKSFRFLHMTEEEFEEMVTLADLKELDDGVITRKEWASMNTVGMSDYMELTKSYHPRHRSRASWQNWFNMGRNLSDSVLRSIQERETLTTKLSPELIYGAERLQVVRYTKHGHYHAHFDSEKFTSTDDTCCHQIFYETMGDLKKCKLCRFITFMYYLNDVEEGGETAFLMADNGTYSNQNILSNRREKDLYNLSRYCHEANLLIKPKKGTAVFWYNHFVDKSGWLGKADDASLHGGCDVLKGEKWIANHWLTAPYEQGKRIPSIYT